MEPGKGKEHEEKRKLRDPYFPEGFFQHRVLEPGHEIDDGGLHPLCHFPAFDGHGPSDGGLFPQPAQKWSLFPRCVEDQHHADRIGEIFDGPFIGGTEFHEVFLEPVDVTVKVDHPAIGGFVTKVKVHVGEFPSGEKAHLFPGVIKTAAGIGTHQPVDAGVNGVTLAFPGGTQPPWLVVHFENFGGITVHLPVDARSQSGKTATNNDNPVVFHSF